MTSRTCDTNVKSVHYISINQLMWLCFIFRNSARIEMYQLMFYAHLPSWEWCVIEFDQIRPNSLSSVGIPRRRNELAPGFSCPRWYVIKYCGVAMNRKTNTTNKQWVFTLAPPTFYVSASGVCIFVSACRFTIFPLIKSLQLTIDGELKLYWTKLKIKVIFVSNMLPIFLICW